MACAGSVVACTLAFWPRGCCACRVVTGAGAVFHCPALRAHTAGPGWSPAAAPWAWRSALAVGRRSCVLLALYPFYEVLVSGCPLKFLLCLQPLPPHRGSCVRMVRFIVHAFIQAVVTV